MKNVLLCIFLSISIHSLAQNRAVTEFRETHEAALSLYFYPSTLRMINLERNMEFDEMIRDIKKARFFKMDSGAVHNEDILKLDNRLRDEGFEEVMFMKSKDMDLKVWGVGKRNPVLIIISKSDADVMLLEVNGMINIAKIPKLTESFNQNSFLDVLNLYEKKN